MIDVLEHPVVTSMRRLAQEAQAAEISGDVRGVEMLRVEMLQAVRAAALAVDELRAIAVAETVVTPERSFGMRQALGRMLSLQVTFWQALQYAPAQQKLTATIRDGLIDVLQQLSDVLEICLFKMDEHLATELQARLVAISSSPEVPGDWREALTNL